MTAIYVLIIRHRLSDDLLVKRRYRDLGLTHYKTSKLSKMDGKKI